MGQEPGSERQMAESGRSTSGVKLPLFSKITVTGDEMHPLFRELTSQPAPVGGPVKWNFQKYLLDRSSQPVAMFDPRTTPDDPAVVGKIEELLAQAAR